MQEGREKRGRYIPGGRELEMEVLSTVSNAAPSTTNVGEEQQEREEEEGKDGRGRKEADDIWKSTLFFLSATRCYGSPFSWSVLKRANSGWRWAAFKRSRKTDEFVSFFWSGLVWSAHAGWGLL